MKRDYITIENRRNKRKIAYFLSSFILHFSFLILPAIRPAIFHLLT